MNCTICNSKKTKLITANHKGYFEGSTYPIFECTNCNTQFIPKSLIDPKIYDKLYSTTKTPGYDRYYKYAKKIKKSRNPLKFLQEQEPVYYPVYKYLKNKQKLKVLEIGCGYGYLTYSINKMGHETLGIDISKKAIDFAKSNFGVYYKTTSIEKFKTNQKYDLIIATELIEHLENPTKFIKNVSKKLKNNGKIIITTPNKDYYPNEIWITDGPPVHTVWLSKHSFSKICKKNNLNFKFIDYNNYYCANENKLINIIINNKKKNNNHNIIKKTNTNTNNKNKINTTIKRLIIKLLLFMPINKLCFQIYKLLNKKESEHLILAVVIFKR